MTARLTILNSMAGEDFESALDTHLEWGISDLDIRDAVYGHWIKTLPLADAQRAAGEIASRGLSTYCLSTSVFFGDVALGREAFTAEHGKRLEQALPLIEVFQPRVVRIMAPQLSTRGQDDAAIDTLVGEHAWVFDTFRDAIARIRAMGATPTIENEAGRCVLSRPREFAQFFEVLDMGSDVTLTWDVQNQWATGFFPSLETLDAGAPWMAYYHVKGGQYDDAARTLDWNVALDEAMWPVAEITGAVLERGLSEVICINPPQHGKDRPGYDYAGVVERDIAFMRSIEGVL